MKIPPRWHIVSDDGVLMKELAGNMSLRDILILMGVGVGFIILGLIGILWGRHEEKSYFGSLATHHDMREFMSHWPERPQLAALKIGGWIALALGVVMLVVGIVLLAVTTPAA